MSTVIDDLDANERLGAFAAALTHDLNQPLMVLGGFLDLLVEHHACQLDADGRAWLQAAQRAAGSLRTTVDALALPGLVPMQLAAATTRS